MLEYNLSDPSFKVWRFCHHVREVKMLGKKSFMDNTQVLNAIKSNDPAKVTSLGNEFMIKFWNLINELMVVERKDLTKRMMRSNDGQITFFHLDMDMYRVYGRNLILIQFALWSCVSEKCFRYITATLINSRMNIKVDEEVSWSWMENLLKCVTLMSTYVYNSYATDHQRQYPCCQVILLVKSFRQISSLFIKLATNPTILSVKFKNHNIENGTQTAMMTTSFKSFSQEKANEVNAVKNDHTLEFFLEYNEDTFSVNHFLSSLEEKRKIVDVAVATLGEGGGGNTPAVGGLQFKQNSANKHITTEEAVFETEKKKQLGKKASSSNNTVPLPNATIDDNDNMNDVPTKTNKLNDNDVVLHKGDHEEPYIQETKFKKLHSWLLRLKKVLDENNGILRQLQKDRISREDYIARCKVFSKSICPEDLGQTDFDHFYRSLAFAGLIMHEVLKCGKNYQNMTIVQRAIFAPILFSCLDGCSKKMMSKYQFWQAFLTKLVPKCKTYSSIRDSSSKLRHFLGQCLNSIGDLGIEDVFLKSGSSPNECLAFYYEKNYLSNNSKPLISKMKSDFEKRRNNIITQKKQKMIVGDSAGVLKGNPTTSKENNDTEFDDSPASNLRKRLRPALDANKNLKKGKKRVDHGERPSSLNKKFKEGKKLV